MIGDVVLLDLLAAEVEIGLAKDLVEATRAEVENRETKDITGSSDSSRVSRKEDGVSIRYSSIMWRVEVMC